MKFDFCFLLYQSPILKILHSRVLPCFTVHAASSNLDITLFNFVRLSRFDVSVNVNVSAKLNLYSALSVEPPMWSVR